MKHLAIIADGNRRWALQNGLPPNSGHVQGLTTIERCCMWAIENGVAYLTIYCFSTENWNRTKSEVDNIMDLARWYCGDKKQWYINAGIRVCFSGRRDRLACDIVDGMAEMECDTASGKSLDLLICADYGGRDEIARVVADGARTESEITAAILNGRPEPDAILRTGGDQRLSNFFLWQAAYAELFFTNTLFPDLGWEDLSSLEEAFGKRKRNFGR